jgi:hypothetical protein
MAPPVFCDGAIARCGGCTWGNDVSISLPFHRGDNIEGKRAGAFDGKIPI